MGKTSDSIYIDYMDTMEKADRLLELASTLETIAKQDIEDLAGGLDSFWIGDSAKVYKDKLQQYKSKILGRASSLRNTANNLKDAALKYYEIEKRALSIFGR